MGYQQALEKAWHDLSAATDKKNMSVQFLSDSYDINIPGRQILSASCNVPAKDHLAVILLHYLAQKLALKSLPEPSGEWIDFNQLEGGEVYYPTFRKRTIEHILRKFGQKSGDFTLSLARFPTKPASFGDVGVVVYPFEEVGILITLWNGDGELGPDANILYDKNISKIFCTEDIVVLTEIIIHQL